jgi:hypothetical protein
MVNIHCELDLSKLITNQLDNERWHWERIESPEVSAGVPDLNGCFVWGNEVWLECKIEPKLRHSQYIWMKKGIATGRNVWIVWWDKQSDCLSLITAEKAVEYRLHETSDKRPWASAADRIIPLQKIDWNLFAKTILRRNVNASKKG